MSDISLLRKAIIESDKYIKNVNQEIKYKGIIISEIRKEYGLPRYQEMRNIK